MIGARYSESHPVEWADFINKIRAFFHESGFLEVFTETLVPAGAFEGTIDPLRVSFGNGDLCELHTSPEMEMKRLLAKHRRSIFQVCKSYRDDPVSGVHWKEFTMLEFYRVNSDYLTAQNDLCSLLRAVSSEPLSIRKISMCDLIREHTQILLTPKISTQELREKVSGIGVMLDAKDDWETIFFKLLIERVEPRIPVEVPHLVYDYPAPVAALSKLSSEGWAERFEVYWKGMEICNGCTELADRDQMHLRYESESRNRAQRGLAPHPFPDRLTEAMTTGFPPSAGVAVGLDRLFRCLAT